MTKEGVRLSSKQLCLLYYALHAYSMAVAGYDGIVNDQRNMHGPASNFLNWQWKHSYRTVITETSRLIEDLACLFLIAASLKERQCKGRAGIIATLDGGGWLRCFIDPIAPCGAGRTLPKSGHEAFSATPRKGQR